ncbi:16010_t:CDS:1, partial [Funneliformis caledonium]
QASVMKYFSKTSNQQSAAEQNSKACIGLTNEKIENYVIKSPAEFGGSKHDFVIAKKLFPKKFPKNSKFSYSQLTSEELQQLKTTLHAHAKWIIEKETLSVRSIKCELFTLNTNKI